MEKNTIDYLIILDADEKTLGSYGEMCENVNRYMEP